MSLRHIALSSLRSAERLLRGRISSSALDPIDEFLILFYDQALGTAIHATPVFEALRSAKPDAHITVATCGIARETIRNNPFIDRVIETPDPYKHLFAAARTIRSAYKPGKLFCIHTASGSMRTPITLLALLAGKALRTGYTLAPELYDAPLSTLGKESQIERNLLGLHLLGVKAHDLEPKIFFTADDQRHARTLLAEAPQTAGAAILVTRNSGGQPTAWPDERHIAVARHLIDTHGLQVLLPGTAADAASIEKLATRIGAGARSVAGKTAISQLAALCAASDLAVTLDTGTLHVARSQMLPLAVIAPAWQDSLEWMPLGKPWARVLKGPWFPAPPPPGYAIEEITAADVIVAVDDLLAAFPPGVAARQERIQRSLRAAK